MPITKHISALLIILCIRSLCFAQTPVIDNLKKALPFLKGTARIDCLNELGAEFSDRYWSKSKYQQTDTALLYTLQALHESQQLHYLKGMGKAWLNMSIIEEEHGNFKAAEAYARKALPLLQKENMPADYHRGCVFLGWILHNRGFFSQSVKIYKNEIPYYEAIKDSEHLAAICRITARAYNSQGNSESAFTYFQKDFAIQKKPKDAWGKRSTATLKASVYLAAGDTANAAFYFKQAAIFSTDRHAVLEAYHLNMAIAYGLQKKYDSALLEIQESITGIKSSNADSLYRKVALMIAYNGLSGLFLSLKKFDSAIIYSRQPLKFFKDGDYVVYLMPVLKTIAAAYREKNENSHALFYTNQLLAYAQKAGARRYERDGYQLLWRIYQSQRRAKLADSYHFKYVLLNDSLQNDKYISQASAWKAINDININEVKFQNQLKINEERNKAKVKFVNNEKKAQLYLFIAAITLISLFATLIIRNNTLKRKKDQLQLMMTEANILLEKQRREQEVTQLQQQKTQLELQALRAQMNPHFIFNCLNSINRFIINSEAAKAADYLTKFAKLIRIVLEQSGKSFVPLEDELSCLRLYMDLEALRFETPFQYQINCNGTDTASVMIPTLLIQPFVENAIWHGLGDNETSGGEIIINLQLKDDVLCCKICDNGVGIAKANNNGKTNGKQSLGIKLTRNRLQLINSSKHEEAEIIVQNLKSGEGENRGTSVDIKIPVAFH